MRYLSVCSGIEAATVAWHPLGWTPVAFSEIEPFPSAVLAHHYPQVPNLGDMTNHAAWPLQPGDIDLLVGGTPCQSFSVAGLRGGLSDPRGGLMLTYLEIARRLRPRWVVWENVPGVLSSNGGRDFGSFLGALGELGYGWAYRVLDAQWVRTQRHPRAVPQRRRRVFVVGCLGDGAAAAAVLVEHESVQRDSQKGRAKSKGAAADASDGAGAGQWWDGSDCAATLTKQNANGAQRMPDKDNLCAVLQPIVIDRAAFNQGENAQYDPVIREDNAMPSMVARGPHAVAVPFRKSTRAQSTTVIQAHGFYSTGGTHGVNQHPEVSPAVKVGSGLGIPSPPAVAQSMTVRRLTPRECERLQAFPDDYTLIPWRKKPAAQCPDGPRYKALGNSMAVNCMEWIGERIAAYEARSKA
jgi:DNA (cytosine-5)-methyltransferase 1